MTYVHEESSLYNVRINYSKYYSGIYLGTQEIRDKLVLGLISAEFDCEISRL
jgi:hypothetical protein